VALLLYSVRLLIWSISVTETSLTLNFIYLYFYMLFIFCYTNILLYEGKSNDFKNKTKKNYDRKIWLFDFCEALARVSGKRQCAKCAMVFLLFLLRIGKKTKSFVFLVSHGFYFVVKFSISFQVCCAFSFLRLVANVRQYGKWRFAERVTILR
jgi:hypothetical protein